MNIKISIKEGCECPSTVSNGREMSEVEHKKRTMLYAPPENDKSNKQTVRAPPNPKNQKSAQTNKNKINTNSEQYRQSEMEMLNELKKSGNGASVDMIQSSNKILQKQSEILEQNQQIIHRQLKNEGKAKEDKEIEEFKNVMLRKFSEISNEIKEIQKIKDEFVKSKQDFDSKNTASSNNLKPPQNLIQMQSNWKNMVQASQNHIEGLENMEGIKNLQNFNIEGYNQAVGSLKKQIAQYQKESDNIERELKIRAAKLEKLEVPPKFEEELYKPYQEHLNTRVKGIDLHEIRDRLYEKIGTFDYGKIEYDIGLIMGEVRSEFANIKIICKEHEILVPDIRIDQKELRNLDIKVPSVLDEYKAIRGIKFEDQTKENKNLTSNLPRETASAGTGFRLSKTNEIQERLKQTNATRKPSNLQRVNTKPIDLSHQTRLSKESEKQQTILQNPEKIEKQVIHKKMKETGKVKDEEFDKYLENRAREELAILYKQKEEKLKRMEEELYEKAKNPTFISLEMEDRRMIEKQPYQEKKEKKEEIKNLKEEDDYDNEEFEKDSVSDKKEEPVPVPEKEANQNQIKQIGRDILKEKLKDLLADKNKHQNRANSFMERKEGRQENYEGGEKQVENMAQGLINLLNNTLTQVNNNLARSIEHKVENNYGRKPGSLERREPRKINVPKLESFNPPPTFNMNIVQQPMMPVFYPPQPQLQEKKIVVENYDKFKIKNDDEYKDYEISSEDDDM